MEQMDDAMKDPAQPSQRIPRMRDRSRPYQMCWALLNLFGIDGYPHRTRNAVKGLPRFFSDLRKFNRLVVDPNGGASLKALHPIVSDRFESAGQIDAHYFYQDIWAAKRVFAFNASHHMDIGSRLDGFVAHVLSFKSVTVIDIRPGPVSFPGLSFLQADATTLAGIESDSIPSLSSLHAAEHFGLGRYGDPIDPAAHLKFMAALVRVLQPGGKLLFSVPTGVERVHFNACRVLSPGTVLKAFSDLTLVSFSAITDQGEFLEDCGFEVVERADYGCGLYEFTK